MIQYLILIIIFLLIIDYVYQNTQPSIEFNKIPALWRMPIFGHSLLGLGFSPSSLFYRARWLANKFKNEGITRFNVFHLRIVNLYDPDDIEVILSNAKYIQKSRAYNFLHNWLESGLLTSKGEKWQTRRKLLTPTFHFNILKQFCKVFVEQANILVDELEKEVRNEETVILPYITNAALQIINETAMGANLDPNDKAVIDYKRSIYEIGVILLERFLKFWYQIPALYNITPLKRWETKVLKTLHGFTMSVIEERRSQKGMAQLHNCGGEDADDGLGTKKRLAMLDLLLRAEDEKQIDARGIREEVDTFMFEGHDTTTMSTVFILMEIANNPDIQDRIYEEITEVLGDSNEMSIEDFNKMGYLEMCIKEGLRLYPSVPFISRQITEEVTLKNYTIPADHKGLGVFIHIFDLHRNPDIYKNPDKFDPERFSAENSRKRHPYAYIPFSAGPRNCIGQRFALLEEKAIISAILRKYKLEPVTRPKDVVFVCDMILRSKDPVKLKFVPRAK